MLWKSIPAETQCLMCHTQRHNLNSQWLACLQFSAPKFQTKLRNATEINHSSFSLEQKAHLPRCTFCQKIGGCRVMKNHTIVQLDWVPHLQHSHKITHTFLKTLWRHGALQHLLKSWPLKLALWSERLVKEP